MRRTELIKRMQHHVDMMREVNFPHPSEETKFAWRIDDARRAALLRIAEMQEAEEDDDDGIFLTSEVRVK